VRAFVSVTDQRAGPGTMPAAITRRPAVPPQGRDRGAAPHHAPSGLARGEIDPHSKCSRSASSGGPASCREGIGVKEAKGTS